MLIYLGIIASIIATTYEIYSEFHDSRFDYRFVIISFSGIIVLIAALYHSRNYLVNLIPIEGGVLLQFPSFFIPFFTKEKLIEYDSTKYILLDESLMLSRNNRHPSAVIDTLTIVDKNGKKHRMVAESSFKEKKNNMQDVRTLLQHLSENSINSGKKIPIFVKYNLGSDPKITPDGEKRRGLLDMDMEIDPDFYFHVIETRLTYKDASPLKSKEFRIQDDDVPHIVLGKYETPEEKMQEIRMRNGIY